MPAIGYERPLVLDALRALEVFQGSDPNHLDLVADAISGRVTFDPGETLCAEGDAATSWWIVLEGNASVTAHGTAVGSIGPGEPVGELAMFDDDPHRATVTATTPLDVLVFDRERFIDSILAEPHIAVNLLRSAARRLRAANDLI